VGPASIPVARKAIISGCRKSIAMPPRIAARPKMDAISKKVSSSIKQFTLSIDNQTIIAIVYVVGKRWPHLNESYQYAAFWADEIMLFCVFGQVILSLSHTVG
jgi:hypothetical protein